MDNSGEVVFQNKTAGLLLSEIYSGGTSSNFLDDIKHHPLKFAVSDSLYKKRII